MFNLSFAQLVALLDILALLPVRLLNLALSLPLAWAGLLILPARVPVERLPDLWLADLGRVAAGLLLTLAGVVAAIGYATGAVAVAVRTWGGRPAVVTFGHVLSGILVVAGGLYLAGRAISWVGAACMLLGACGSIWSYARWGLSSYTGSSGYGDNSGSPPGGGSVYDSWR